MCVCACVVCGKSGVLFCPEEVVYVCGVVVCVGVESLPSVCGC